MCTQSSDKNSSRSRGWTKYVDEIYDPIKVGSIDGKLESAQNEFVYYSDLKASQFLRDRHRTARQRYNSSY